MADLTLEELADRVEKLSGPDREVECRIWCHLQGWRWIKRIAHKHPDGRPAFFAFRCSDGDKSSTNAPRYTASIDAAMTLIPTDGSMKMLSTEFTYEPDQPDVWAACVVRWYPPTKTGSEWHCQISSGATPALSVVVAALHARARANLSTQRGGVE